MSRRVPWRPTFSSTAGRRSMALASSAAKRGAKIRALRAVISGRRPLGLPAFRGYRPVGLRRAGEKKLIDIAVATYQVHTTGSFTLLNGCIQGSDYNNRIGRKIFLKSLYIRGYVAPQIALSSPIGADATTAQQVRMIIFLDNQPNGATPVVTDLLNTATPSSQLNLNNRDRFKILNDEVFVLNPISTAAATFSGLGEVIKEVNIYRRMGVEAIYNAGNAGTVGDINSGALYMFWIGSNATGTNDANAIVSARVRFLDP